MFHKTTYTSYNKVHVYTKNVIDVPYGSIIEVLWYRSLNISYAKRVFLTLYCSLHMIDIGHIKSLLEISQLVTATDTFSLESPPV